MTFGPKRGILQQIVYFTMRQDHECWSFSEIPFAYFLQIKAQRVGFVGRCLVEVVTKQGDGLRFGCQVSISTISKMHSLPILENGIVDLLMWKISFNLDVD